MSRYFVDSINGNDSNAGITLATAWKTLARVQTAMNAGIIDRGDSVLLKRGGTWYEPLPYPRASSTKINARLYYGAYGTGPMPRLVGYMMLNDSTKWAQHAPGVWKIDLNPALGNRTGNVTDPGANVGHLLVDNQIRGYMRDSIAQLVNAWDYYTDPEPAGDGTAWLYVRSELNPATTAIAIGAAPPATCAPLGTETTACDLEIDGWGFHGFRVRRSQAISRDVRIIGNYLRRLGGSRLSDDQNRPGRGSRAGNGIECWIGSEDVLIAGNTIEDIYDVAFTQQGDYSTGSWGTWDRYGTTIFMYNTVKNANQSIEFWSRQLHLGMLDTDIHHNIFVMSGYSWGSAVRTDKAGKGNHIMTYRCDSPLNARIHDNVFIGVKDNYRYHVGLDGSLAIPAGMQSYDNFVLSSREIPIQYGVANQFRDAKAWVEATGQEKGTVFASTPGAIVLENLSADDALAYAASYAGAAERMAEIAMLAAAMIGAYRVLAEEITSQPYRPGHWTPFQRSASNSGTYNTPDTFIGSILEPVESFDIASISCHIDTVGGSGNVIHGGIYEWLNYTWIRIADLGSYASTVAGGREINALGAKLRLLRGSRYLLVVAIQGSGTPAALRAVSGGNDPRISSSSAVNVLTNGFNGIAQSGVSGALPESLPGPVGTTLTPTLSFKTIS